MNPGAQDSEADAGSPASPERCSEAGIPHTAQSAQGVSGDGAGAVSIQPDYREVPEANKGIRGRFCEIFAMINLNFHSLLTISSVLSRRRTTPCHFIFSKRTNAATPTGIAIQTYSNLHVVGEWRILLQKFMGQAWA